MGSKKYCYICGKEIKHPELMQPIDIIINSNHVKNICAKCKDKLVINKVKNKIRYK